MATLVSRSAADFRSPLVCNPPGGRSEGGDERRHDHDEGQKASALAAAGLWRHDLRRLCRLAGAGSTARLFGRLAARGRSGRRPAQGRHRAHGGRRRRRASVRRRHVHCGRPDARRSAWLLACRLGINAGDRCDGHGGSGAASSAARSSASIAWMMASSRWRCWAITLGSCDILLPQASLERVVAPTGRCAPGFRHSPGRSAPAHV